MADNYNPGQESVAQTAAPNIQAPQARFDPNGDVNSLLQALGSPNVGAQAGALADQIQARKVQEQSMKIAAYTQQFMDNNKDGGPVSQAQVKALFPDMVPVIAANVAESIGKIQGGLAADKMTAQIDNDDSLRLDPAKRAEFIANYKADAFKAIGSGNEFYAAGMVQGTNAAFAQNEQKWQAQTAQYHEQVQKVAYGQEIVQALQGPDAQAAMLRSDENWSQKSSLNNLERNSVAVDAVIKYAQQTNNPAVLDQIPQRFLNVDSKEKIYQTRIGIQNYQIAQVLKAHELQNIQRSEATRTANIQTLNDIAGGKVPDPGNPLYLNNPDAHAFMVQQLSTPTVPPANSQRVATTFETSLYASGMVGKLPNVDDLMATIQRLPGLNPDDRAKLMAKAPDIVKGSVLMNSDSVRQAFRDHVQSGLDILGKAVNPKLQALLTGTNLVGAASQLFEGEIQRGYKAYYESNGNHWPDGDAARAINSQAVQVTNDFVAKNTSIQAINSYHGEPAAPTVKPATAAAGGAPTPIPSAVKQPPLKSAIDAELARRLGGK